MRLLTIPVFVSVCLCSPRSFGQNASRDSTSISYNTISDKTIDRLGQTYSGMTASVNKQSQQLLQGLQRRETGVEEGLQQRDSSKARQLLAGTASFYQQWQTKLQTPAGQPSGQLSRMTSYVPGLDSVQTAIRFLSQSGLPTDKLQKLQALSQQLTQLQGSLQTAGELQGAVSQHLTQLQSQLSQYGLQNRLSGIDQQAFYYQQQIAQYKDILSNGQQQQQAILTVVRQVPAFQSFWQKYSILSQLFPMPANGGTLLASVGLQTSAQVGQLIEQRQGTLQDDNGAGATQFLTQQAGSAQGDMDQLKSKLDNLHLSGGSSDMVLPDFTPNTQKTKSLFKRLEYGFNIQSTGSTSLLPAITTLGLSLGYKLSDKATVGVGGSYMLGMGNSITAIQLSNQGAGLRSFLNLKAYKSLWLTGGYEYNYLQQFSGIRDVQSLSAWQRSALIGVMKQYNVGKQSGNVQLLYDVLADTEIPRGQALKLRFGFTL